MHDWFGNHFCHATIKRWLGVYMWLLLVYIDIYIAKYIQQFKSNEMKRSLNSSKETNSNK